MTVTVPLHSDDEELTLRGPQDAHARALRNRYDVTFAVQDGRVHIDGEQEEDVSDAVHVVREMLGHMRAHAGELDDATVERLLNRRPMVRHGEVPDRGALAGRVQAKTKGQERYIRALLKDSIIFAIGPAGTGKTYLAAAVALAALQRGEFKKLVLVRPAVEAGEHLGFLPGDYVAKVNPYLRPLYDALSVHLEPGKLQFFIEQDVIEIAPLAYMRGRTLDNAFIILDEAQNTTSGQMKMFLTRMGEGSKIVVTGDETQVDLPRDTASGLKDGERLLRNIKGISLVRLDRKDIVRHPLVQRIVHAYEHDEVETEGKRRKAR